MKSSTFFLFVLVFALTSCAPMIAPRGMDHAQPEIERDSFLTRDGLRLPLRHWDATNPRAFIVALHGMSDYSSAFDTPATLWSTRGISTYAYDQRSFGGSPNRGIWPGAAALESDLTDFVETLHDRYPRKALFILGESMGGAVVLSTLAGSRPPRADGIILVAPAVWSRADMPASYRAALWMTAHFVPSLSVSGSGLKIWPSDNIAMLKKLARDPLFQHSTRADAVYGLVNLMDEARRAPKRLIAPPPILFLYGSHDQVIPSTPTQGTISELGTHAEVHRYDHGYHMLLRDLEGPVVWEDIATWVDKIAAPTTRKFSAAAGRRAGRS